MTGGKRRTKWQALTAKKYPRMDFLGGDGEWLICIQCPSRWRYRLFDFRSDAEAWLAGMDQKGCGHYVCRGKAGHRIWKLL
jgi:hypothetical protein